MREDNINILSSNSSCYQLQAFWYEFSYSIKLKAPDSRVGNKRIFTLLPIQSFKVLITPSSLTETKKTAKMAT
ncbi:hypothetical protein NIES4071_98590 [Calothrix sp. NIES-4071]|nr:hypothetical protein NIES4071_98590 [Calothrix sp. NIES-4071]BAZ64123.1 hypothetical protein NIES4105_98520 [Calothrix sp. NIES-4105]